MINGRIWMQINRIFIFQMLISSDSIESWPRTRRASRISRVPVDVMQLKFRLAPTTLVASCQINARKKSHFDRFKWRPVNSLKSIFTQTQIRVANVILSSNHNTNSCREKEQFALATSLPTKMATHKSSLKFLSCNTIELHLSCENFQGIELRDISLCLLLGPAN